MRRPRGRRLQDDRGTTLVEMLVAAGLISVVLAIAATALVSGQRSAAQTVARVQTTDAVRVALDEMTRTLRTAVRSGAGAVPDAPAPAYLPTSALQSAGPSEITFFANDRPVSPGAATIGPTQVTYSVIGGALRETRVRAGAWDPATKRYGYPGPATVRTLATGLSAVQPTAVFRYLARVDAACVAAGTCGAVPAVPAPSPTPQTTFLVPTGSSALLTTADLALVRAISISMKVDTPRSRTGASAIVHTLVQLPNGDDPVTG